MKTLYILSVIAAVAFISCNKNSIQTNTNTGTLSATIDDTAVIFNLKDSALLEIGTISTGSGLFTSYILSIEGATSNGTKILDFFAINNLTDPITVGTYTSPEQVNASIGTPLHYFNPGSIVYSTSVPATTQYYLYSGVYSTAAVSPFSTITITSIDSMNVQGTFSGIVGKQNGSYPDSIHTITNGEFNLPITIRHN
jgi:hypothetical protein